MCAERDGGDRGGGKEREVVKRGRGAEGEKEGERERDLENFIHFKGL